MGFDITSQALTVGTIQRDYLYELHILGAIEDVEGDWDDFIANIDLFNASAKWGSRETDSIKLSWGGQFRLLSGVDKSSKQEDFVFYDDESGRVYNFLTAAQAITGAPLSHIAVPDALQGTLVSIYEVNTLKAKVTKARLFTNFRVFGVKKTDPNKESNGISKITATCVWDQALDDLASVGKSVDTASSDLKDYLAQLSEKAGTATA